MINYIDFYNTLKEQIQKIDSPQYKEIINYCPEFYLLLCNILMDKKTDWNTKMLINSAIAYFVLTEDIIPDYEADGFGFVDDIFITCFVLVEIKDNIDEKLLLEHWHKDEDILSIVDDIFIKSKILIGDKYIDILQLVGLKKYISLDLYEFGDSTQRISRLVKEKNELIGLLAFITQKLYFVGRPKDVEGIIRVLREYEDYGEIERILSIARDRKSDLKYIGVNSTKINYDNNVYAELRTKRIERILRGRNNDV